MTTPQTVSALFSFRAGAVQVAGVRLLQDLDIRLAPGERLAVTGPSGCGKTTLLRTLAGLIPAADGVLRLVDEEPETIGWPLYRRRAVYVDQQPALFDRGVEENLARPFGYRCGGGPFPKARAERLMQRLLLDPALMKRDAVQLSVGQKQRICLLRALLLDPHILFLDEPTSALDSDAVEAVEALLLELSAAGLGLVMVTHDAVQAARLCGRRLDLVPHLVQTASAESAGKEQRA